MSAPATEATHPLEIAIARAQSESIEANLTAWDRFAGSPKFHELQALHIRGERSSFEISRFAHAADVRDAARLAELADKWNAPAVYLIANPIAEGVATRDVAGSWHDAQKGASTSDAEIANRSVLVIDIDARRPKGTSATAAEMSHTSTAALAIHGEVAGLLEDVAPLAYAHTGNGRMLFLALDALDVLEAGRRHHAMLIALAARFTDARVEIDRSVHDAKRLVPAWGTLKKKGAAGIAERPHRRTAFVAPAVTRRLRLEDLDALVVALRDGLGSEVQREIDRALGIKAASSGSAPRAPRESTSDPFALAKNVPMRDVLVALDLLDDESPVCPGCGLRDSGVAIVGTGLKCSHARCAAKGIRDGFRTTIDVVVEAKGLSPIDAVRWLGERFGFDVAKAGPSASGFEEPPPGFFDDEPPLERSPARTSEETLETSREPEAPAALIARLGLGSKVLTFGDVVREWSESGELTRLPTGLATFDEGARGGIEWPYFGIAGAPPGHSKTSLLVALGLAWARDQGCFVCFGAWDEGPDGVTKRAAKGLGWRNEDLDARRVESMGELVSRFEPMSASVRLLRAMPVEHALEITRAFARATSRRAVLIADSIQKARTLGHDPNHTEKTRIDLVLSALKHAANDARDVLVLATSELNRDAFANRRKAKDVRRGASFKGSGNTEYDAELTLTLDCVNKSPLRDEIVVSVDKHRGYRERYSFGLALDKLTMTFAEIPLESIKPGDDDGSSPSKPDAISPRLARTIEKLFAIIMKKPGLGTFKLRELSPAGRELTMKALAQLEEAGRIEDRPSKRGETIDHHWFAVPKGAEPNARTGDRDD